MNRDVVKLMTVLKPAARHPDRFSDDERTAMVALLGVHIQSPNNWVAIKATEVVIAMEARNIKAEHAKCPHFAGRSMEGSLNLVRKIQTRS